MLEAEVLFFVCFLQCLLQNLAFASLPRYDLFQVFWFRVWWEQIMESRLGLALSGLCGVHGKQNWRRPRWYSEAESSNACSCSQWKVRAQNYDIFLLENLSLFSYFLYGVFPFLSFLHPFIFNSIEQAKASHVYSYRHGFRGFAAKLTDEQAHQISSQWKFPPFFSPFLCR